MNLKDYLYMNRINNTQFAEIVNFSRNHVTQVINGKTKPSRKLVKIIAEKTNGEVTEKDFEFVSQKDDKRTIKKGEKKV